MTPLKPEHRPLFAILTVCLEDDAKPASDRDAYNLLKAKLGLKGADIDDAYGAMPLGKVHPTMVDQAPKNSYLVLVSNQEAFRLWKEKHPNVVGVHHAALVHSGAGPQPLSPEDAAKLMQFRKPKGPGL